MSRSLFSCVVAALATVAAFGALAQDKGDLNAQPLPALADPSDAKIAAKPVFGRALTPADLAARSIGFYSRGCLAGAKALPVDGEAWQVMRLSRNRNWGHPEMIAYLERVSRKARAEGVWPGILVGDISQPRGGPMLTGHLSHQIGLDADVWLTPMPDKTLSPAEREEMSAVDMVAPGGLSVDRSHWSQRQTDIIRVAASDPDVDRIFVNAAIKKALCETEQGQPWMTKVRAYWGHNYHFHVRIHCPKGDDTCTPQEGMPSGDGCDKSLAWWFTDEAMHPKADPKAKPKPPITLAQLPPECRKVAIEK